MDFQLVTSYKPRGDQPRAIEELMEGLAAGERHQVLLGVTGSARPLPWPRSLSSPTGLR